ADETACDIEAAGAIGGAAVANRYGHRGGARIADRSGDLLIVGAEHAVLPDQPARDHAGEVATIDLAVADVDVADGPGILAGQHAHELAWPARVRVCLDPKIGEVEIADRAGGAD